MMTTSRRLILWDVDHTLLDTGGVGRDLYRTAFEAATGRRLERAASISGSTELRILAETLALHEIVPSGAIRDLYAAALASAYRDSAAELHQRGRALDGAIGILAALAARGDAQTVVTGNLRSVTATKLGVFGLDEHLDLTVGAYAEDDEDRGALIGIAIRRVRVRYGDDFGGRTVMVGDTPADVQAALAGHVPVIAVATGRSTQDDLAAAGALATLPSLADIEQVRATIDRLTPL
jgi:phosphoglycolate phosphatase